MHDSFKMFFQEIKKICKMGIIFIGDFKQS